jgi:hypothetical protein
MDVRRRPTDFCHPLFNFSTLVAFPFHVFA